MKRYREYSQVDLPWLKEMPSHWETKKINQLFEERMEKVSDKLYPPLSVTKNGILPQMEHVAKTNAGDNRKKVLIGDFVINSRSDRKGSSGVSQHDGSVSLINTVLKIRQGVSSYWHYLLRSVLFQEEFYRNGKGIVADLWSTNYQSMKSIVLPIPPQEEQDKIANYLDWKINEIDRLIEKEKILLVFLEKFFESKCESLIKHVILDSKLKFKLRHLARFQNGISESGDFFTDGFPFVSYSDVYNNTTLPSEVKGKAKSTEVQQRMYSVNKGDIFVTRTSETIDDAISFSLCEKTIPNSVFSGFLIRIRPTKSFVLSKYLLYYLKTTFVRTQILKNLNLVTRVSVGQSLLKDIEIKIPDKEVQEYVIQTIDEMSNKIEGVKKRINEKVLCLQKLKQSLISEVVTGKIDVRDIEIPVYEKVNLINEESDDIENKEE